MGLSLSRQNRWLRNIASSIALTGILSCSEGNHPPTTRKPTLGIFNDRKGGHDLHFVFRGEDDEDGYIGHFKYNLRECDEELEEINWQDNHFYASTDINMPATTQDKCYILSVKAVDSEGLEDPTPETLEFTLEGKSIDIPLVQLPQYESLEKITTKESGEVIVSSQGQESTIKVVDKGTQQPLEDILITSYNNPEKRATIIVASDPSLDPNKNYFAETTFLTLTRLKSTGSIRLIELLRTDYRPYYIHIIPDFPDFVPDNEKYRINGTVTMAQLPDFYRKYDSAWNNSDILEYILGESAVADPFLISLNNARKKTIEKAPMITDLLGRVREKLGGEGIDSHSWYLDVYQVSPLGEILPILVHRTNYKDKLCTLEGKVLDILGNPVRGALVWADNDSTYTTDREGNYRITHLREGRRTFIVTLNGYQTATLDTFLVAPKEPTPARPPKFTPTKNNFRLRLVGTQVAEPAPSPNNPPYQPLNIYPTDYGTNIPLSLDLEWSATDPDRDTLTYDVFFEANDPTPDQKIASNISTSKKSVSSLLEGTTYHWKVTANDNKGGITPSHIWRFTTRQRENQPPRISNINPPDGAINVPLEDSVLSASIIEPEGDRYSYRIYLEPNDLTPDKIFHESLDRDNLIGFHLTFAKGFLQPSTIYYWQVEAWDEQNNRAKGSIWNFTTEGTSPNPISESLEVLTTIPAPSVGFVDDLVWDKEQKLLWYLTTSETVGTTEDYYYAVDTSGNLVHQFPYPQKEDGGIYNFDGLALNNQGFWTADAKTLFRLNRSFQIEEPQYKLDNIFPEELTWFNNRLFTFSFGAGYRNHLIVLNPSDNFSKEMDVPSRYGLEGLTSHKGYLLALDNFIEGEIVKFDPTTLNEVESYKIPIQFYNPVSMTSDGTNIWLIGYNPATLLAKLRFK